MTHLAGHALRAVAPLMGHALPVTPGFQNKQIAALNLLKNMQAAGALRRGMTPEQLNQAVTTPLTNQQVTEWFLKDLDGVVKDFLRGQMPVPVHPVVSQALGQRTGLLTDGCTSQLPWAKGVVEKAGIGPQDPRFHATVAHALILGQFPVDRTVFLPEPDPRKFKTRKEWQAAVKKQNEGLPDRMKAAVERAKQLAQAGVRTPVNLKPEQIEALLAGHASGWGHQEPDTEIVELTDRWSALQPQPKTSPPPYDEVRPSSTPESLASGKKPVLAR